MAKAVHKRVHTAAKVEYFEAIAEVQATDLHSHNPKEFNGLKWGPVNGAQVYQGIISEIVGVPVRF